MSRYVRVRPSRRRLALDIALATARTETFQLLVAAVAIGLLVGVLLGGWGGVLG